MYWKGIVQNIAMFFKANTYLIMLPLLLFDNFNIVSMHITAALYNYRMGLQELKWVQMEKKTEGMSTNLRNTSQLCHGQTAFRYCRQRII